MTISTNGGNQAPCGMRPKAEPISVNECASVKPVTTVRSCRKPRSGMTRHMRNSKWSNPPTMWATPRPTNPVAARKPRRIEIHFPRSALDHDGPAVPVLRQVAERQLQVIAQFRRERRAQREDSVRGGNGIDQVSIDIALIDNDVGAGFDRGGNMSRRLFITLERAIRRKRESPAAQCAPSTAAHPRRGRPAAAVPPALVQVPPRSARYRLFHP